MRVLILPLGMLFVLVAGLSLSSNAAANHRRGYNGQGYYDDHQSNRYENYGGGSIRCESRDGRYQQCAIGGRGNVQLIRQLSRTTCIEGRNWGIQRGAVWVSNGCRADFAINSDYSRHSNYRGGYQGNHQQPYYGNPQRGYIQYESGQYGNGFQGGSHGYNNAASYGIFECSSNDSRYNYCPIQIGRGRVQIEYQLSRTACVLGSNWGFDRGGIWVNRGCRAQFVVR